MTNVEYIISLRDKFSKTMRNLDRQTKKTESSMGNLSSMLGRIGIAYSGMQLGKHLIKMASDAEETDAKFQTVFQSVDESAKRVSKNLADNYGLSSKASKQLLSDTGDLLTGFGFTGKQALGLSEEVNKLAVDLASFTNFEGGAEGASQALTKALLGERESVKSLGIAILDSDVKARVRQMESMGKLTGLTERQKTAYATLNLAQEQSKNAIGDFARTQDSFANRWRTLRARVDDVTVTLGKKFLPIISKATAWATKNLDKIVSVVKTVVKVFTLYKTAMIGQKLALRALVIGTRLYRIATVVMARGIKGATMAMKSLKASMISTGIGALVVALGFAVEKLMSFGDETEVAADEQERLNEAAEKFEEIQLRSKSIKEKIAILDKLNRRQTQELIEDIKTQINANEDRVAAFETQKNNLKDKRKQEILDLEEQIKQEQDLYKKQELQFRLNAAKKGSIEDLLIGGTADRITGLGLTLKKVQAALKLKPRSATEISPTDQNNLDKVTSITAAAPKIFNINIDKLVDTFNVSASTISEGTNEVKDKIIEAFMGAINDVQIIAN